eukprot:2809014-Rhodomonas_salina.1
MALGAGFHAVVRARGKLLAVVFRRQGRDCGPVGLRLQPAGLRPADGRQPGLHSLAVLARHDECRGGRDCGGRHLQRP